MVGGTVRPGWGRGIAPRRDARMVKRPAPIEAHSSPSHLYRPHVSLARPRVDSGCRRGSWSERHRTAVGYTRNTVGLHVQDLFMKIILGLQYGRLQRRNARQESISIPVCAVFSPPWLASPRRAALDKMGLSNHRNPHFLGQNQPKCSVPKFLILRQDRDCPRWPIKGKKTKRFYSGSLAPK